MHPPMQSRSRQCAAAGCSRRPVFNHPAGEGAPAALALWCQDHKQPGMVDMLNRLCSFPGVIKNTMNWKCSSKIQRAISFSSIVWFELLILHYLHDCLLGILSVCSEQQSNSVV